MTIQTERISENSWYLTTGELGWSLESVAHDQYERWDSDYSVPGLSWLQAVAWAKGKINLFEESKHDISL